MERVHKYVAVEVDRIVRVTSKAVLAIFEGFEQWIPKSQLRACDYFKMGDQHITLDVVRSFARKEGLW